MKIYVTDPEGIEHALDALEGWRVMEIIRDHGLRIKAECGGACCCATCHVYVDPEWIARIPQMREDEENMLDEAMSLMDTSRLSCQIIFSPALDGLKVTIAPENDV